jgi:hypothetical protein
MKRNNRTEPELISGLLEGLSNEVNRLRAERVTLQAEIDRLRGLLSLAQAKQLELLAESGDEAMSLLQAAQLNQMGLGLE